MEASLSIAGLRVAHTMIRLLSVFGLTDFLYPPRVTVSDGASYDYVIVGGGTAGCVLANRLTEDNAVRVLMIEAGDNPPFESIIPALFLFLMNSIFDWNLTTRGSFSTATHRDNAIQMPAGKMLGGSSAMHHLIYARGDPTDYISWAAAANDSSWGYEGILPYLKKSERLEDPAIEISQYRDVHGMNGNMAISRLTRLRNQRILNVYREAGNDLLLDTSGNNSLGYNEPLMTVSQLRMQQNMAFAYLTPIRSRSNLHVLRNTYVTKILLDNNNVATGVQAMGRDNVIRTYQATREVLMAAGAFKTPQLLMLSGIGPKDHLMSFGITPKVDLPVGENLQDQAGIVLIHKVEDSLLPADPRTLFEYPLDLTIGYVALNKSQRFPDYQTMNFYLDHDSPTLPILCLQGYSFAAEICQQFVDLTRGRNILMTDHCVLHPKSRGSVQLQSTNPQDDPLINIGYFSDNEDLESAAQFMEHFHRTMIETPYFRTVRGEVINLNLPQCANLQLGSREYWRCYALNMASTNYHYCGTTALGTVVDSRLRVKGVQKLRVIDAGVMPTLISGNILTAVLGIAEKGADLVKQDNMPSGHSASNNMPSGPSAPTMAA